MGDFRFLSLLYIPADRERSVNTRPPSDPVASLLRTGAFSQTSFKRAGVPHGLVTNDLRRCRGVLDALGLAGVDIVEADCQRSVPSGIAFRSAHFKLDLIAAMGRGEFGARVALVDLDTVLLRPPVPIWGSDGLLAYDITSLVLEEYGTARVRADLERVAGRPIREPRWFGGECLLGSASACADLSRIIEKCWPRYLDAIGSLHHVGDEMVVSAALNIAIADGMPVLDLGATRQVTRWWTARTGYRQVPFTEASQSTLLHLPSDKPFLAAQAVLPFDPATFLMRYRRYARRKLIARRLYTLTDFLGRGATRHVARMR